MAIEWDDDRLNELREQRLISQLLNTQTYLEERIAELELASEDVGWERLNGATEQYEFSLDFLKRIVARSRLFYLQNPLINRAVSIQADYIFAQGVNIQATNQSVNEIIQDFIDDPLNKREFTGHQARLMKEQTLLLDGNVFLVLFTDKQGTGHVNIRSIITEEIVDIITNPDDANEVWFYKREWQERTEDNINPTKKTAYYPDIDYFPRTQDPRKMGTRNGHPVYWDAPIIHIKTGALAKSRYGIPETYSALDWAKYHSKMLADWATIISMFARWAFKVTTPGTNASIAATKNKFGTTIASGNRNENNPAPVTGSMFITKKDGVDIEPIKTSGATTSAKDARELRIMVAAAMGLPDPMLSGEVDVGNLATAKTLDRPTELKFRSRQQLWTDVTQKILDWVIRWAIEAPRGPLKNKVNSTLNDRGKLVHKLKRSSKENKSREIHVEVVFPPILEKTIQERIDAVIGAVTLNGKTFSIDSPELKKLTIRLMLQALGLNDVDELVEQIFAGLSDDDLKDDTGGYNNGQTDSGNVDGNGNEPARQTVQV